MPTQFWPEQRNSYHRYIYTCRCLQSNFISLSVEISNSLRAQYQPLWICPRLGLAFCLVPWPPQPTARPSHPWHREGRCPQLQEKRGGSLHKQGLPTAAPAGSGEVCLQTLVHISPATCSQDLCPTPPLPNTSPTWACAGSSAILTAGAERCHLPPAQWGKERVSCNS